MGRACRWAGEIELTPIVVESKGSRDVQVAAALTAFVFLEEDAQCPLAFEGHLLHRRRHVFCC